MAVASPYRLNTQLYEPISARLLKQFIDKHLQRVWIYKRRSKRGTGGKYTLNIFTVLTYYCCWLLKESNVGNNTCRYDWMQMCTWHASQSEKDWSMSSSVILHCTRNYPVHLDTRLRMQFQQSDEAPHFSRTVKIYLAHCWPDRWTGRCGA